MEELSVKYIKKLNLTVFEAENSISKIHTVDNLISLPRKSYFELLVFGNQMCVVIKNQFIVGELFIMIPHYTKIKANKFFPWIDAEYDVLCGTHLKEGWVPNHAFSLDILRDEEFELIKNLDTLLELSKPNPDDIKKYNRYGKLCELTYSAYVNKYLRKGNTKIQ